MANSTVEADVLLTCRRIGFRGFAPFAGPRGHANTLKITGQIDARRSVEAGAAFTLVNGDVTIFALVSRLAFAFVTSIGVDTGALVAR